MRRFVVLVALLVPAVGCSRTGPSSARTRAAENLDFPVGTFSLTERSDRTITDRDLLGKVWVASFIFTRCPGPCKDVTATVTRLQKELADEPNVRFVSFTVDPTRDDPATLRGYAKIAGADGEKWLFLTGDEAAIHGLAEKQFKQSHGEKPGPNVKPGEEFAGHSTRLSVVDKKGVIRAIFDGTRNTNIPAAEADAEFQATLDRLKAKVRELAREP